MGLASLGARSVHTRHLLRPALLRLPLTRVQTNSRATATDEAGNWQEVLADTPRFQGPARRLMIGPARTNGNRNPRCEGALLGAIGSGGALPTRWAWTVTGGLACTVVSVGRQNGVDCVRLRFAGTATTTSGRVDFEPVNGIAALPSQTWSASMFVALVAAPAPANVLRQQVIGYTAGGAVVAGNNSSTTFTPSASLTRHAHVQALTSAATIAHVTHGFNYGMTVGVAYDFTVDIGWPQMELGAFATTPILPLVGTPAAAARGVDIVAQSLSALGIGAGAECTLLFDGIIGQAAPAGVNQTILCIDDGTNNNRFVLHNPAGGSALQPFRVTAGAVVAAGMAGSYTPGERIRAGVAIKAGRIAASLNGGAVVAATGGPTAGLTTARMFGALNGAGPLAGEAVRLDVLPFALSDSLLRGMTAQPWF